MSEPAGKGGGEFDGAVAVVTGGASGIGQAVAEELAARGARVAVLDLKDTEFVCDVTDDATVRRAITGIEPVDGGMAGLRLRPVSS
ncbi:SDR family NAD(P)-dependent oxidoreductase [Sphaerisporangium perillae]|uniref:SDR family NAD(P)-dependent oxidoreductase n=1 Tax=Sphaerisporangium perillae TaxID=2935860 RepID=UPI00200D5FFA|nr:SDR family NAD(P)-dependent oxidoreductase [Sphaerisporangium perillae]